MPYEISLSELMASEEQPPVFHRRVGAFAVSTDDGIDYTVSAFLGAPLCLVYRDIDGGDGLVGPPWAVDATLEAMPELSRMLVAEYAV